jgi:hypothetical protein
MSGGVLSVYDNKLKVGELHDRGPRQVEAFAIVGRGKRKSLGIFRSRQEAARAVDRPADDAA